MLWLKLLSVVDPSYRTQPHLEVMSCSDLRLVQYVQFAAGIAVLYIFLLVTMRMEPYVIVALNNLQVYSLIILVLTLFCESHRLKMIWLSM